MDFATVPAAPPARKNQRATSCPAPISAIVPYQRRSRLICSAFCSVSAPASMESPPAVPPGAGGESSGTTALLTPLRRRETRRRRPFQPPGPDASAAEEQQQVLGPPMEGRPAAVGPGMLDVVAQRLPQSRGRQLLGVDAGPAVGHAVEAPPGLGDLPRD